MDVAELTIEVRTRPESKDDSLRSWYDPDSASYDDAPVATAPERVRRDARSDARSRVLAGHVGPDPLHVEWG